VIRKSPAELKVGIFAAAALVVIAWATVRVSDKGLFGGGSYRVTVVLDSAEGLTLKTPVEVAGIQVGHVEKLDLEDGRRARADLRIDKRVVLGQDAVAQVRTKGFLGETYIELKPGDPSAGTIEGGGRITATNPYVDLGQIASDVKEITESLKKMVADEQGPVNRVLKNMETFTKKLSEITVQNHESVNQIVANLRNFSSDLQEVMADRKESLKDTMARLNSITRKVDEGRGTIGRLVNDGELADNINEAARGVSETIGGVNRFQFEVGYHVEYLGETKDFKNYVGLALKPRPDKYFLLEFVVDPNPSPVQKVTTTNVTAGGSTTTVVTDENVVDKDKFLFSAQLAKEFRNFTLRGGLIESRGGVGVDYNYGPFGVQFSAFDFRTDNGQRPHLKVLGSVNVTKNIFLVSGVDDFISKQQDPDWFLGAGLKFVDNDLRSLLGAASLR
jgi:phospholipid/cholesterol/gamma-HCH transport system substrate-binding protein